MNCEDPSLSVMFNVKNVTCSQEILLRGKLINICISQAFISSNRLRTYSKSCMDAVSVPKQANSNAVT